MKLIDEESRAIYVYCGRTNSIKDALKNSSDVRYMYAMGLVQSLIAFIRDFPKRLS